MIFSPGRQASFYRNFKFEHKTQKYARLITFVFENRHISVLKDVAVYALTFYCNCCRFETEFMTIFKIRGYLLNSWFDASNDYM